MSPADPLRELPAVHELAERLAPLAPALPRPLVVAEIRRVLDAVRSEIRGGAEVLPAAIEKRAAAALAALQTPSLRRVINATGVVLHTNLGRAPLPPFVPLSGYSNLEYDLASGRRGKRDLHAAPLLERLTGAPAIVVNNNAAAVFLALHELAAGGEAIISRGELIEIGDGFRIPEIMQRSGATIREVGTTNRTSLDDYRAAISGSTRLIMRVHPSNFRILGFTARPELRDLAALTRERGIPLYEDLGSGCVTDLKPFGVREPLVKDSLAAGADLISFSGDKLMGGPQAGIISGRPDLVSRLRRNPMFRALRLDKVICQALENTLRSLLLEQWDQVPAIAMIRQSAEEIRRRAESMLARVPALPAVVIPGQSVIGGGATPEQPIPTFLIALETPDVVAAEKRLRAHMPPVIARIEGNRLLLDLRTVLPEEDADLLAALQPPQSRSSS